MTQTELASNHPHLAIYTVELQLQPVFTGDKRFDKRNNNSESIKNHNKELHN